MAHIFRKIRTFKKKIWYCKNFNISNLRYWKLQCLLESRDLGDKNTKKEDCVIFFFLSLSKISIISHRINKKLYHQIAYFIRILTKKKYSKLSFTVWAQEFFKRQQRATSLLLSKRWKKRTEMSRHSNTK